MIRQLDKETIQLIKDLENMDPFQVSLKLKNYDEKKRKFIANQVGGRKKARLKIPEWFQNDRIIFPETTALEQASSEVSAKFKSSLISGLNMLDITGGFCIDSYFFSKSFKTVDYVERNSNLAEVVAYNFKELHAGNIRVHKTTAQEFIQGTDQKYDWIYIDPSRRIEGKRVFNIEDSEPDIIALLPRLNSITENILIKLSPFIDISHLTDTFNTISAIYVVAINNECKEVLLMLGKEISSPQIQSINITNRAIQYFSGSLNEEKSIDITYGINKNYLYDPNAALRKTGLFNSLANSYNIMKIAPNSHLYSSDALLDEFPGRAFTIKEIYDYSSFLKHSKIKKANISVRNFKISVEEIRKRTRIQEGGDEFIFCTTDTAGKKIVIVANKA